MCVCVCVCVCVRICVCGFLWFELPGFIVLLVVSQGGCFKFDFMYSVPTSTFMLEVQVVIKFSLLTTAKLFFFN